MHFDFSITAGQLVLFATLVSLIWRVEVFSSWLLFEHEILMQWFCEAHGIRITDLTSRRTRKGMLSLLNLKRKRTEEREGEK